MAASTEMLNRVLDSVGRALSPEAARRLVALRADPDVQTRIDYLADRANDGTLSSDERDEYESWIATSSVIAILQSKARIVLLDNPAA